MLTKETSLLFDGVFFQRDILYINMNIFIGSGNYTVWYLNGTKCPKTAALRIAMGQCVPTNIASLHQGHTCTGYSGLILGFGLFGDMMKDCEQYRWMGTSRFKGTLSF